MSLPYRQCDQDSPHVGHPVYGQHIPIAYCSGIPEPETQFSPVLAGLDTRTLIRIEALRLALTTDRFPHRAPLEVAEEIEGWILRDDSE